MLDPAAAPHQGESLLDLHARVGVWLAAIATAPDETTVAVTHGGVVRSAVTHALSARPAMMWQIEIAPLSITELELRDGSVTLLNPSRQVLKAITRAASCEIPSG